MKGLFMLCGVLATTTSAHIQMSKPYPIRSPLNMEDTSDQKDYSYTNPLNATGSDYPCKGYADDPFQSQASYQPGGKYEMELEGSATHGGGSCQIALTYDKGKTFKVLESILGNCPDAKKYQFTVPTDAPSGNALLAWTWFNKLGNREMYMNCAMVTVGGGSNSTKGNSTISNHIRANGLAHKGKSMRMMLKSVADKSNRRQKIAHDMKTKVMKNTPKKSVGDIKQNAKKATSFNNLPPLFVANVDQTGQCKTIEDQTVNFPLPGDNVIGTAGDSKGYECSGNAPFLGNSGNSSNSNSSRVAYHFSTPTANTRILSTEASTNNDFKNYVGTFSCSESEIVCSPDGTTWAYCSNERPVYMGPVAGGTSCRMGSIVPAQ